MSHEEGIQKARQRTGNIEGYRQMSGNRYLPKNEIIFTLGANCADGTNIKQGSELDFLMKSYSAGMKPFIKTDQYFSVERDPDIHKANCVVPGPFWFQGDFEKHLSKYVRSSFARPIAILNADLMCGWNAAILHSCLESIAINKLPSKGTLLSFNFIQENPNAQNRYGVKFQNVKEAAKSDLTLQKYLAANESLSLIDTFPYPNGRSLMVNLLFWWGLERKVPEIRYYRCKKCGNDKATHPLNHKKICPAKEI